MPAPDQQLMDTLLALRDGQREVIRLLAANHALAEEQVRRSQQTIAESVGLQRLALRRQKQVTLIAVPGLLACIGAIAYLIWRWF